MKRVCVFCGSRVGERAVYREAAAALGGMIARRSWGLVYGGGNVGLMGIIADAALAAGGEVIGVIPQGLEERELAHQRVTELRIVGSMHERKATMAELADAFVALPGGIGTMDEFFEALTWAQLGIHRKPCALLNVEAFFDPFLALLDHFVREGYLDHDARALVRTGASPEEILSLL